MHQKVNATAVLHQEIPADLAQAGAIVDKTIEYMMGRDIEPLSVASALLGGALALLAGTLDEDAIVLILNNAIAAVRAGDLQPPDELPRAAPGPRLRQAGTA